MQRTKQRRRPGRRGGGPHPIDVHVGSRVKLRRNVLGLSQEKLGEALGLTFQQVQRYERGVNRIGASRLLEIARVLQVPIAFFYDDVDPVRAPPIPADLEEIGYHARQSNHLTRDETVEFVTSCYSIDEQMRRRLFDLAKALWQKDNPPLEGHKARKSRKRRVPLELRQSTISAFRGENRPAAEIGSLLGVRYVLYGSMRVYGHHLRLTAELTDASTGGVIWRSSVSEHFFDLVEIQTRLADAVVRCVAPHLYRAEYSRARSKRAEPLGAHDLLLRAQENMNNSSRVVFETSERLFDEAINLDPEYASALAWRAYWHVVRVAQGWSPDPVYDAKQADRFSQRAVGADELDPMALAIHGHVAAYLHKDFDTAFRRFEAALRLNPNAAPAWLWSAAAHAWIGDGRRAVEEANQAITLSPFDPLMCAYSAVAGMAYLADAQYDRALECGLRSMGENRGYSAAYKLVILAHTLSGRKEAASSFIDPLLAVEPVFSVERYRRVFPGSETSTGKLYADALATAGVPLNSKPRARLLGPV